jgi:ribonuclease D
MTVTLVDGDLPADLVDALRRSGVVAVDTETSGLDWRSDALHLCQLFTPEVGTVMLRRVEGVPTGLASVLADTAVLKVLHFAPFDLRFLEAHWGVQAMSVACTKAASRLLEPTPPSHSLKPLLERHLGVVIEKGAVRTSDWSAESLSDEQIAYASGDVSHLLDLHGLLVDQLERAGLLHTFRQVCAYMPVDAHLDVAGYPNPLIY